MPIADSQTAQRMAAKSHEARRYNAELRAQQSQSEASERNGDLHARAEGINKLLEGLKARLSACADPRDCASLATAIDRLENCYARYAGIPSPGHLKPTNKRPRIPTVEPIE